MPFMFWMYGGALSCGSIFQSIYNGSVLATHDIVLVYVNYRVGPYGFLYGGEESAPGNVGFHDQQLGLEWVRENIHLFGGDKNQITIFGESAGSWSVSAHLLSPLSKGLFKRAIMQSAAYMNNNERPVLSTKEALVMAKSLAKKVKCDDNKDWLKCLRQVDPKLLTQPFVTYPVEGTQFLPLTAQEAFNEHKFNKDLDLMVGVTKDEGTVTSLLIKPDILRRNDLAKEDFIQFVKICDVAYHNLNVENITRYYLKNVNTSDSNAIKWKIWEFFGDLGVKCPVYHFTKRYAELSSPETNVYFYELTHILNEIYPGIDLGVYHTADLPFVFGSALLIPDSTEENIRFTKEVMKLWTDFAKYGKPDKKWPKFIDTKTHSSVTQIKELNPKDSNKYLKDIYNEKCDSFWKNYYLGRYEIHDEL